MSLDYVLYLHQEPDLQRLQDEEGLPLHDGGDGWELEGLSIEVSPYTPRTGDPLDGHPGRGEVQWELTASGHMGDFDAWERFVEVVIARCRGHLWDPQAGTLSTPTPRADGVSRGHHPATRDELRALLQRAFDGDQEAGWSLNEAAMESRFVETMLPELLMEHARAGGAAPEDLAAYTHGLHVAPPERKDARTRAAFAQAGPFARAIVRMWDKHDRDEADIAAFAKLGGLDD